MRAHLFFKKHIEENKNWYFETLLFIRFCQKCCQVVVKKTDSNFEKKFVCLLLKTNFYCFLTQLVLFLLELEMKSLIPDYMVLPNIVTLNSLQTVRVVNSLQIDIFNNSKFQIFVHCSYGKAKQKWEFLEKFLLFLLNYLN